MATTAVGKPYERLGGFPVSPQAHEFSLASGQRDAHLPDYLPSRTAKTVERIVHRVAIIRAVHESHRKTQAAGDIEPLQDAGVPVDLLLDGTGRNLLAREGDSAGRQGVEACPRIAQGDGLPGDSRRRGGGKADP
jgi:hypothetical protein